MPKNGINLYEIVLNVLKITIKAKFSKMITS